jgi:branched-chain amino acid transport system ATP-binding protein
MTAILDIQNVTLRFNGIIALDDVSLTVEAEELIAVVGPNGAGKTSLLNCVTGAYHVSAGHIRFEGIDITRVPAHTGAKRGISRTFQHNELFPQLSTLENLLLGRHAVLDYGLLSAGLYVGKCKAWELRQREKVEQVVEFFELEPYRKAPVGDLPFGIQKLIGLARAFAAEPRLVLLDEPSAGLNRQEKEDLARYLLRVRHEFGPTIIWIEHDMQLVRDLADRVFVLHYGKGLATGSPQQVLSDPRVVEAYLGGNPTEIPKGGRFLA